MVKMSEQPERFVLQAPDFTLKDVEGRPVSLSDYRGQQHVILVFNRGFA
jgi:peroxiredoxin